ncbi:hypothetical protein BACCAP_04630 [Pseudoflavonifractor capillosus ATCC 29799]|uniref:Uncharacterized protein n=1 Tax=Pseudoflavonifractor capillosus ATCC 29799 TaxID=411467 RepID=A6P2A1_9FIRM|nr:hypothetical protein BACCAP_04630 [Pseudoflavonifractor capillosus ATCC 29799]
MQFAFSLKRKTFLAVPEAYQSVHIGYLGSYAILHSPDP